MKDTAIFFALGALLTTGGIYLIVGAILPRSRWIFRDGSGIRLPQICQFLMGLIIAYLGVGGILSRFDIHLVRGAILAVLVGVLVLTGIGVELRRSFSAWRRDKRAHQSTNVPTRSHDSASNLQ